MYDDYMWETQNVIFLLQTRQCSTAILAQSFYHLFPIMPKSKKEKPSEDGLMDVKGLAREWDDTPSIRDRVREGGDLLHPESGPGEDIKTVIVNQEVLAPMVMRMAAVPKRKPHPPIEPLREEVAELFKLSKRSTIPTFSDLSKLAWRLRYLVCFVKTKARRKEVSTETCMHPGGVHKKWLYHALSIS